MIPVRAFANADVAVFGLARSGVSSVAALKAGGARVLAWDDNEAARDGGRTRGRHDRAVCKNGRGIT